jgi:hypothetical protein
LKALVVRMIGAALDPSLLRGEPAAYYSPMGRRRLIQNS